VRRDLATVLTAALLLAASPRRAACAIDTRVRLDYHADEQSGCAGEEELRRMVADQLGHDPFRSDAEQRVAISIAKTDAGFRGRIVWTEPDGRQVGERNLSSRNRDCREIASNLAFAVALQLQLIEQGGSTEPSTGPPTAEPSPPTATDQTKRAPARSERPGLSAEAPARPEQASPARLRLAVGAGPAVGIGLTPETTAFGRLFVVARLRRFSAEIGADAALPATDRESDGSGVVVNALGSSVAGCAHVSVVSACLLGRVGWIRARGIGITDPSTSWGRFGEVGARLAGTRELGRFMVSMHVDGLVMLSRWDVVLSAPSVSSTPLVVWRAPRVGALVGLDVALRFF
jgi:hypothetical protein